MALEKVCELYWIVRQNRNVKYCRNIETKYKNKDNNDDKNNLPEAYIYILFHENNY